MRNVSITVIAMLSLSGCMSMGKIETRKTYAYAPIVEYVVVKACGRPDAPAFPKLGGISNEDC